MSWETFIYDNIKRELIGGGFSPALATSAANEGVDLYRRMSQASRKGKIFDDCLRHAKLWAERNATKEEKKK